MTAILLGQDSNAGGRKYNEDRCAVETITTPGGQTLAVGLVCDGVGGEERGERAAQLAIDTALAYLKQRDLPNDIPQLISNTLKAANGAVYAEALRLGAGERMACTMVLAIIVNGQTLHIGNAGDSRIYLCRGGQLQQLTRDHTFANVMVWMGKLTPEAANAHAEAHRVMRVLGPKDNVQADQGFYLTTTDYGEANRVGRAGLPLRPGDSVLLCSDGLIKNTATTHQPLITPKEIIHILQTQEGVPAARAIMGTALGRIPVGEAVDNLSVALLQTPDPARAVNQAKATHHQREHHQRDQRRRMALAAIGVAIPLGGLLVVALISFGGLVYWMQGNVNSTATQLAQATVVALAQTQTVEAFTATPSPMPLTATPTLSPTPRPTAVPTLLPGEIAKLFAADSFLRALFDDKQLVVAPPDQTRFIAVNHTGAGENANLHLQAGTQMQFDVVIDPKIQIKLLPGSALLAQTGLYPNGIEIELVGGPVMLVAQGCLAAHYVDETTLQAECYSGVCAFSTRFGADASPLAVGQQLTLDLTTLTAQAPRKIPAATNLVYWQLLQQTAAGRADLEKCRVPAPPRPTAVPTASATPTPPPHTPTALPDTGGGPTAEPPGNTPQPPPAPSNTSAPPISASDTPAPPLPSDTPLPPSATQDDCRPYGSLGRGKPTCTPAVP